DNAVIEPAYTMEDADGTIWYSFAVSEVLYGEEIKPETIITVSCEQGITPLKSYREISPSAYPQFTGEEADRTYIIRNAGEPFVRNGEEYILFLSGGQDNRYYVTAGYAGKFKQNEDSLYERTIPEFLTELNSSEAADFGPVSLDELKERIAQPETKNAKTSETSPSNIAETTAVTKEDILDLKDHTAEISGAFGIDMENAVFVPVLQTDPADPEAYVYDTIDDLCFHSDNIVRGKIVDLAYRSDGHSERTVYYSVAVFDVFGGEQIQPGTVITVQEDTQGYIPLKSYREQVFPEAFSPKYEGEEENGVYLADTLDKPFAKIGEKYVFFLSTGSPSEDIDGNYYSVTSGYGGKFRQNEDGLYERAVPEIMEGLLSADCVRPQELEELIK
ncbi:MAG: hypothetical protein NC086_09290, partial [Alistipes sp.]|nr:hypothetical protein [Alistipes sp.]